MPETDIIIDQNSHVQQLIPVLQRMLGQDDKRPVVVIGALYLTHVMSGRNEQVIGIAKMSDESNRGRLSIPKNVREAVGMVDGSEWSIMLNGKDVILRRRSVL